MSRIYGIGIIFVILALNIPEVSHDLRSYITFYSPVITSRLRSARDIVEPAVISVIGDLQQRTKTTINDKDIDTSDTWSLRRRPSITAEQFDTVLRDYNSPAAGVGIPVTAYAKTKEIDNAYVLYIFIHESTAGTSPNWNADTRNVGNIVCAGYSSCIGYFRRYDTWEEGFKATIDLLAYYRDELHIDTIDAAINKWAPPIENDTNRYVKSLKENVSKWRAVNNGKFVASGDKGALSTFTPIHIASTSVKSVPLVLSGCLATNVRAAHYSSPALREFSIISGDDWSFNERWQIDYNAGVVCNVFYGGICDMAGRYSNAAHKLGLQTEYTYHGFNLQSLSKEDSTAIWSTGDRGGQDLVIKNTTRKTAYFHAYIDNGEFIVTAYLE